jgi:hypothetical protein
MKKAFLFAISFFLSANISYTCWFDDSSSFHKIFDTDIISDPSLIPFIGFEKGLWMGFSEKAANPVDANLVDWRNYTNTGIDLNDIAEIIYKTDSDKLIELTNNKKVLSEAAKKNKFLEFWNNNQRLSKSIGNYLIYAKKCEMEAMRAVDEWSDTEIVRDPAYLKKIIEQGIKEAKKNNDPFLKRRYAFQALRMAFYLNDFEKTLSLFDTYFAQEVKEDYIYFRALEIKAGVLHKKSNEEAAYLYSKVFMNCPDRREICLRSFSVTSESSWNRSVNLCKNNEEKAVFYALRGLQSGANILEEILNIAEIVPNSALLELLVARYISNIQPSKFPVYLFEPNLYPQNSDENNVELLNLKKTINVLLTKKGNRDFWLITSAYVDLLNKNTEEAMKTASEVSDKSKLKTEAETVRFTAKICGLKKTDPSSVNSLWQEMNSNEHLKNSTTVLDFWNDAVSVLYLNYGEKARSFLVQNNITALREKLDLKLIEYIDVYLNSKEKHTAYDVFLIKNQCGDIDNALNILREMRAMFYLQRNNLDLAIEELEKCSKEYQNNSAFFNSPYINKTIWTEMMGYPMYEVELERQNIKKLYEKYSFLNKDYNLLTYIKQLKDLELRAEKDSDKAAEYYYLLGLARYNTGVWGWHRPLMYFRESNFGSAVWWTADKEETPTPIYKNYEWKAELFHDVDIAKNYLSKALKYSNNSEMKAKTIYLMAKVEKIRNLKSYWDENYMSKEYYELFKDLKSNYSKTAFYKEILRECYDFSVFVSQN